MPEEKLVEKFRVIAEIPEDSGIVCKVLMQTDTIYDEDTAWDFINEAKKSKDTRVGYVANRKGIIFRIDKVYVFEEVTADTQEKT